MGLDQAAQGHAGFVAGLCRGSVALAADQGLAQLLRRDGFEHVSDAVGVDVE